jgi:hypothetical protein
MAKVGTEDEVKNNVIIDYLVFICMSFSLSLPVAMKATIL